MAIWFALLVSMICIQVPNLIAMNKSGDQAMTLGVAFTIGLMTIPTGIIANTMMSYFFGAGSFKYSYVVLTVATYAFSLIISLLIQFFYLKDNNLLIADYLMVFFVLVGLSCMIFREDLSKFLTG